MDVKEKRQSLVGRLQAGFGFREIEGRQVLYFSDLLVELGNIGAMWSTVHGDSGWTVENEDGGPALTEHGWGEFVRWMTDALYSAVAQLPKAPVIRGVTDAPARHCDPTDEQLEGLMRSAAEDGRIRAEDADRRLKATLSEEVQRIRQRYLSKAPATSPGDVLHEMWPLPNFMPKGRNDLDADQE